jgi:predicted nicotinamide N-methyase
MKFEFPFCPPIFIAEEPQDQRSTGSKVWSTALALCTYLADPRTRRQYPIEKKRCLEVGAGCGLTSCVLAALQAREVVATDVEVVLERLRGNLKANSAHGCKLSAQELLWGNAEQAAALGNAFDVIVGSDVVYQVDWCEPLVNTLAACSNVSTTVFLALEQREPTSYNAFLQCLHQQFNVR